MFIHVGYLYSTVSSITKAYSGIVIDCTTQSNVVVVHRSEMSLAGPTRLPSFNPKLCFTIDGDNKISYFFEANLTVIDRGLLLPDGSNVKNWLISMEPSSSYCLCPGLPSHTYPPSAKRLRTMSFESKYDAHAQ